MYLIPAAYYILRILYGSSIRLIIGEDVKENKTYDMKWYRWNTSSVVVINPAYLEKIMLSLAVCFFRCWLSVDNHNYKQTKIHEHGLVTERQVSSKPTCLSEKASSDGFNDVQYVMICTRFSNNCPEKSTIFSGKNWQCEIK